jgi:hypothetical protein
LHLLKVISGWPSYSLAGLDRISTSIKLTINYHRSIFIYQHHGRQKAPTGVARCHAEGRSGTPSVQGTCEPLNSNILPVLDRQKRGKKREFEQLADQIFKRSRTPAGRAAPTPGASLASRVGIAKVGHHHKQCEDSLDEHGLTSQSALHLCLAPAAHRRVHPVNLHI